MAVVTFELRSGQTSVLATDADLIRNELHALNDPSGDADHLAVAIDHSLQDTEPAGTVTREEGYIVVVPPGGQTHALMHVLEALVQVGSEPVQNLWRLVSADIADAPVRYRVMRRGKVISPMMSAEKPLTVGEFVPVDGEDVPIV